MVGEVTKFASWTSGRVLTLSKKGCFMASSQVILSWTLNLMVLDNKSKASSPAAGKTVFRSFFGLFGKDDKYAMTLLSVT